MVLQRAMQVMKTTEVVPKATSFKRKYDDLKEAIRKAEGHLRYENDVDPAYTEDLDELLAAAEDLLDKVDDKIDHANRKQEEKKHHQEEERRKEAQIAKCLPRSSPQKWDGSIRDFIKFKDAAKVFVEHIPDSRLAMDAIVDMISDISIKKRLARYRNPAEALNSLELEYGNPELSGPNIINDMKELPNATGIEDESSLIMKIKELYVSLSEIRQEQLLGRNELYGLCHKLRERNGEELLKKLSRKDPDRLREVFFHELDEVYTNNTIWTRTGNNEDDKTYEVKGQSEKSSSSANIRQVAAKTEPRQKISCKICNGEHHAYMCDTLAEMDLKQFQAQGICTGCLGTQHDGTCLKWFRRYQCGRCGLHKGVMKLHVKCAILPDAQAYQLHDHSVPAAPPQQEAAAIRTHRFGVNQDFAWRSPGGQLSNPNPLNTALELVDHAIIQAPDGRCRKVRILNDQYAADSTLADVSLESFSHRTGVLNLDLHTANGTTKVETDEMVLKVIMPDGQPRFLKTIATKMRSQKAFKLVQKCIDVPLAWNSKHFNNTGLIGQNGNMRCLNFTEGPEIELLLGSDNAFLSPIEMDRYEDAGGGVVLYRSCLQNDILLLGGSRLIGPALVPKCEGTSQRGFRLTTQNNIKKKGRDAFVRRTVVKETDDEAVFPEKPIPRRSKMGTQFCKEDADSKAHWC